MNEVEKDLKKKVKKAFADKKIEVFIGYGKRPIDGRIVPVFIHSPDRAEELVWNPMCTMGLAKYALKVNGKIGLFVRGCDSRAINVFLQESQLDRDSLYLIGGRCHGVTDQKRVGDTSKDSNWEGESVSLDGKKYSRAEVLAGQCLECRYPEAIGADEILGEARRGVSDDDAYANVVRIESMGVEEKNAFWDEHLSRCIRCDACRNICPVCYCEKCVLDQTVPAWVSRRTDLVENRLYHSIRFMHVAGRCVDCGECERACPMEIPLRLIAKKLEKDAREMFSFEVGTDPEETPMFSQYREEDKAEFIR